MWKYCVEIRYWMMRDLSKPYHYKYDNYCEQRYFKTKAEATKAFSAAVKETKALLAERMQKAKNCHEKMVVKRFEVDKKYVMVAIYDRFWRSYKDEIGITFITKR